MRGRFGPFRAGKDRIWLKLITFTVITAMVCQSAVWAKGNTALAPKSRVVEAFEMCKEMSKLQDKKKEKYELSLIPKKEEFFKRARQKDISRKELAKIISGSWNLEELESYCRILGLLDTKDDLETKKGKERFVSLISDVWQDISQYEEVNYEEVTFHNGLRAKKIVKDDGRTYLVMGVVHTDIPTAESYLQLSPFVNSALKELHSEEWGDEEILFEEGLKEDFCSEYGTEIDDLTSCKDPLVEKEFRWAVINMCAIFLSLCVISFLISAFLFRLPIIISILIAIIMGILIIGNNAANNYVAHVLLYAFYYIRYPGERSVYKNLILFNLTSKIKYFNFALDADEDSYLPMPLEFGMEKYFDREKSYHYDVERGVYMAREMIKRDRALLITGSAHVPYLLWLLQRYDENEGILTDKNYYPQNPERKEMLEFVQGIAKRPHDLGSLKSIESKRATRLSKSFSGEGRDDGKRYWIKVANETEHNKYADNEWDIIEHLCPGGDDERYPRPVFKGTVVEGDPIANLDRDLIGCSYIVFEEMGGEDLDRFIERKKGLLEKETVGLAIEIADIMKDMHDKNTIYRDLKANNIRILPDGKVKIYDFNLSWCTGFGPIPMEIERACVNCSEMWLRRVWKSDKKTDIFAFGLLLFRMLTDVMITESSDLEEGLRKIEDGALKKVIEKCLAERLTGEGYEDFSEIIDALDKLISDAPRGTADVDNPINCSV